MDVTELRPLGGADEAYVRQVLGALGESDPRPNASLQAIIDAYPAGRRAGACTEALPFSSARKYSGAAFSEGDGRPADLAARRARRAAARRATRALAETERAQRAGPAGAAAGPRRAATLDDPRRRRRARGPPRWSSWSSGCAPTPRTPCATSRSRTSRPRSSPATTRSRSARSPPSSGLPGAEHPVDARTLPADQDEMAEVARRRHSVFGRVTPQQKRDMVGALQSRGHTVAMTGDGVNDVLALKDADIGVAMGSGSEATRAVAQIVLLNNSFATLPSVVAEGRRVIGNITRVATLFLAKTVYSVLLALLVVCCAGRVPVPAPPPDAAVHADHRRPGLLPGARAQQGAGQAALRAPGDAVRDPRRGRSRRRPPSRRTCWPGTTTPARARWTPRPARRR